MTNQEAEVYIEVPRRYLIARTIPVKIERGKELIETAAGGKFRIPSVWINQQARQEREYEDSTCKYGNWVLEGILFRKRANNIFTRIGLPYSHPKEAALAYSKNREYTFEGCTQDEIERAIAEGLEIDSKDLDQNDNLIIPCSDFGSNKYGLWFFGGEGTDAEKSKRAKESGEWLINSPEKRTNIAVYFNDKSYHNDGKDFATQLWFGGLEHEGSGLGDYVNWGWYRDLIFDFTKVIGVYDTAEIK